MNKKNVHLHLKSIDKDLNILAQIIEVQYFKAKVTTDLTNFLLVNLLPIQELFIFTIKPSRDHSFEIKKPKNWNMRKIVMNVLSTRIYRFRKISGNKKMQLLKLKIQNRLLIE